jgi:hypothetical protein
LAAAAAAAVVVAAAAAVVVAAAAVAAAISGHSDGRPERRHANLVVSLSTTPPRSHLSGRGLDDEPGLPRLTRRSEARGMQVRRSVTAGAGADGSFQPARPPEPGKHALEGLKYARRSELGGSRRWS